MSFTVIELRGLQLKTDTGTYGPNDTKPDMHLLKLILGIAVKHVVIASDVMEHVLDYAIELLSWN